MPLDHTGYKKVQKDFMNICHNISDILEIVPVHTFYPLLCNLFPDLINT